MGGRLLRDMRKLKEQRRYTKLWRPAVHGCAEDAEAGNTFHALRNVRAVMAKQEGIKTIPESRKTRKRKERAAHPGNKWLLVQKKTGSMRNMPQICTGQAPTVFSPRHAAKMRNRCAALTLPPLFLPFLAMACSVKSPERCHYRSI